ncbi:DUF6365 family protein [Solwaraspora sp. WMMB335]|uniref:DUF6365 family protein n=1 Tax=Solwaraspora sp. WMMB335 TaxID=3404118 RepID=UPI003B9675F5
MTSRRRTVLFLVTSYWAHGELAIATEFARRMAGTGFHPLFLIPPTHRELIAASGLDHQVMIPGAGKLNRIQLRDIQHVHRPALVVLADFMNYDFCDRHYGLTRADLSVFDCPVGTFDNFSWGRADAWLDTYGFKAKYEGDITLDGLAFRLRPCPLNNPVDTLAGPDVHPYPLLESVDDVPTTDRAEVRREIGVTGDRPVVLVTGATWQRMHAAYPRVTNFVDASHTMLEQLLTKLLRYADVVAVGPQLVFHDRVPDGFHPLGPMEPGRFRRLIQGVDLHISNNIVSVSLHRLALSGIPSVVLMNSLTKRNGRLRWLPPGGPELTDFARQVVADVDYLYPCRMFPVGWHRFLRSLLADNPFSDTVAHVEMFDEEGALATIVPLLSDGPRRDALAAARDTYLAALRKLSDVDTILRQVAAA